MPEHRGDGGERHAGRDRRDAVAAPEPPGARLRALDAGRSHERAHLGRELAVRLRASELAQAVFFAADGAGERERIVQLHTLEQERGDWIRWAGAEDRLQDLAEGFGGGLSIGAAARLEPLLALSRFRDDEQIRATVWAGCWHEAERR